MPGIKQKIDLQSLVFAEIPFATPALDEAVDLRNRVLRIPLELEFNTKDISSEWKEVHVGLFSLQHKLLACAVMKPIEPNRVKMRQVAVEPEWQGKGVGSRLVLEIEKWGRRNNMHEIILHARDISIPFYEKLKYKKIGTPFYEVNIVHYKMKKILKK